jgi:hypothetical protein
MACSCRRLGQLSESQACAPHPGPGRAEGHLTDGIPPGRRDPVWLIAGQEAALAPAWIEFDGAAQVAQLRRTVTKNGRKTVEVVYLITSDRNADPATLAAWVRGHWEIENRLHWVGVTFCPKAQLTPRIGSLRPRQRGSEAQFGGGPALPLEFFATMTVSTSIGCPETVLVSGFPGQRPPIATLSRMKKP